MKKLLLFSLLLSFTTSSFFFHIEAKKKEVTASVGWPKEKNLSAGKQFGVQFATITLSMVGIILFWAILSNGFKTADIPEGFFGKKPKWKWFNLIFFSVIYVFGAFYGYFFLEKLFSGKTNSMWHKMLSGIVSFLIMGIWGFFYFFMVGKSYPKNYKEAVFSYLFDGLRGALTTSILPWLIYKGILQFINKELLEKEAQKRAFKPFPKATKKATNEFTQKRLMAQAISIIIVALLGATLAWFKLLKKGKLCWAAGFFGKKSAIQTITHSFLSAIVAFYLYLLIEKGLSHLFSVGSLGSTAWLFSKLLFGFISLAISGMITSFSMHFLIKTGLGEQQMTLRNFSAGGYEPVEGVYTFDWGTAVITTFLGGLFQPCLGWLIYKGIDGFILTKPSTTPSLQPKR